MEHPHQEGGISLGTGVRGLCLPQTKKYPLVLCEASLFLWSKPGQCVSLSPRSHQAGTCLAELISSFSDFDWGELNFFKVHANPSAADLLGLGSPCHQPSLLEVRLFVGGSFGTVNLLGSTLRLRIGIVSRTSDKVAERLVSLSANEDHLIRSQCILLHFFCSNLLYKLIFFNLNARVA